MEHVGYKLCNLSSLLWRFAMMTREETIFFYLSPPQKCNMQHRLPGNWGPSRASDTEGPEGFDLWVTVELIEG